MNSTTTILSIDSRRNTDNRSRTRAAVRAWCIRLGSVAWYELQAFGARRALREMRLMGLDVSLDPETRTERKAVPALPPRDAQIGSPA